jgi:tetratricopeptide (TPR) repeat protein
MPQGPIDWTSAVLVLAGCLVLGAILVARFNRVGRETSPSDLERRDLLARRDDLIQQLRDLVDTSDKRSAEQLESERAGLELEAARVLRRLDLTQPGATKAARKASARAARAGTAEPAATAVAPVPATPASQMRGFLWGVGSMAALGLLVFWVARGATERGAGGMASGGGGMSNSPMSAPAANDPLQPMREAVEGDPENIETRLALVRAALGQNDLKEVFDQTQFILQRVPGHPKALAYQGLVRMAMGETETAVRMLKQSLAADPDQIEAYLHLALVYVREGKSKEASTVIDEAARRHPKEAARLRTILTQMKEQDAAERAQNAAGGEGQAASAAGPDAAAPSASAAAADAPADPKHSVAGSLDLDAGAKKSLSPGAVVFLTLRPDGGAPGPPYAAKRLPAGSFPLPFRIGSADSMMGQELPDKVRIEARVDSDGDPLTRNAADPSVIQDGVRLGSTSLKLVMHR